MDIKEIEQYLKQLRSVENCRILLDDEGNIQEIHIVSNSSRSTKQISRDVQSILISRFGIDTDYKKISIAQIEQDGVDCSDFRLKLRSIEYSVMDLRVTIRVVLEKDGEFYGGTVSGANTSNNIQRLLGRATLQAVEKFCEIEDTLVIEDIEFSSVAGKEIAVVAVTSIFNGNEQLVSGSSLIKGDKKEAVVKATLDAINRIIVKIVN